MTSYTNFGGSGDRQELLVQTDSGVLVHQAGSTLNGGPWVHEFEFKIGATAGSTSYTNTGGSGDRRSIITVSNNGNFIMGSNPEDAFIDGSTTDTVNWWSGINLDSTKWFQFDFGAGNSWVINEFKYYQQDSSDQGLWVIKGSNDGEVWDTLTPRFRLGGTPTQTETSLSSNTSAFRYYRFEGREAKSGLINGVTSSNNLQYFPTQSVGSEDWIKWDFGAGKWVIIDEVKFYQQGSYSHGTWKFQGSDDDSSWADVGSSFTLGDDLTTQTITALNGNTTGYRYYRIIGVSGTTSPFPWIYQFEFKTDLANEVYVDKAFGFDGHVTEDSTFTVASGVTLLVVGVAYHPGVLGSPANPKWNNVALTRLATINTIGTSLARGLDIWYLKNPDSGFHHLTADEWGYVASISVACISGSDTTNPFGSYASANNDGTTPSVNVNSSVNSLVLDVSGVYDFTNGTVPAPQQMLDSRLNLYSETVESMSCRRGDGSAFDMQRNLGASKAWGIIAVPILPASNNTTTTKNQTGISSVLGSTSKLQSGQSRVISSTERTQVGNSRLEKNETRIQSGLSRISVFTQKLITSISRVQTVGASLQPGVARINSDTQVSQLGKSSVQNSTLKVISGIALVTSSTSQVQNGVGRVQKDVPKTVSGLSRIVRTFLTELNGLSSVIVTGTSQKTQSSLSRITNFTNSSQEGVGRILSSSYQTNEGLSKITSTTVFEQVGKSSVENITLKTNLGKALIQTNSTSLQGGQSRVEKATLYDISGKSKVGTFVNVSQSGLSRLKVTSPKFQTAVSKITSLNNSTQSGASRILNFRQEFQIGVFRLTRLNFTLQEGISRVEILRQVFQPAVSSIVTSNFAVQDGKSLLKTTSSEMQIGLSRVVGFNIKVQDGVARIGVPIELTTPITKSRFTQSAKLKSIIQYTSLQKSSLESNSKGDSETLNTGVFFSSQLDKGETKSVLYRKGNLYSNILES